MGDLSAARIEKAGVNGQTLAVTHDRNLIGILIPVTQDLVQFLIERNMSSVLDSIRRGEGQIKGPAQSEPPGSAWCQRPSEAQFVLRLPAPARPVRIPG